MARTHYQRLAAKAAAITEVLERNKYLQLHGVVLLGQTFLNRLYRLRSAYLDLMTAYEIKHFQVEECL